MAAYRDRVNCAKAIVTSCMAAYRGRVYGAGIIVTSCMAAYRDRVNCARAIVTSLYDSLQEQSIWYKCNCNEFVWQLTGREFMA